MSHFTAVIANPENADAHFNLAISLQRAERWDAAAQSFGRSLCLDRQWEAARIGLGACLLKLNRMEDALQLFDNEATSRARHCLGRQ